MKSALILKSMSIHFPHNIRISLAQLKKNILRPDFPPSNLVFRFKILPRRHEKFEKGVM